MESKKMKTKTKPIRIKSKKAEKAKINKERKIIKCKIQTPEIIF